MPSSPPPFPAPPLSSHKKASHNDIRALQAALSARGCDRVRKDDLLDEPTAQAVKLFKIRFSDPLGNPLAVDGIVGPLTWATLFGVDAAPTIGVPMLASDALEVAVAEVRSRLSGWLG
jgi:peptidoglycan hydrolase-like protein with peptidoglycan-binding domain